MLEKTSDTQTGSTGPGPATPDAAKHAAENTADILLAHQDGPILILTLNRPQKRNCLSEALIKALHQAFLRAAQDKSVKAVLLGANGPLFSSGHDLKEMTARRSDADGGHAYYTDLMHQCAAMMQSIIACPKPVIAMVQGLASAAGCQLVATCDLAVASDEASFCTPGVNIGLFCSTPMVALSRNLPRKQAMEMLLLGDQLSAESARDYGLVNRVVAHDKLHEEAHVMAQAIASKAASAVSIGKEAFYKQLEMPLTGAYDYAAQVMAQNMVDRNAVEGINAFIEKRPAQWREEEE